MFNASKDQAARQAVIESRRNAWAIMFAGLVLGMVGMHLTAIRPLKMKMEVLKQELAYVQQDLNRSVQENRMARESSTAASDLAALQEMLISNHDRIASAAQAIEDIALLNTRLANLKAVVEQDAYNVDIAADRVNALLNLKDQIMWRGGNTSSARNTVDGLLMLRDGLASEAVDVSAAGENLERLLAMESKLARRQLSLNDEHSIEIPRSLFEGLPLDNPLPGAARLANLALETSTPGRAYRGFEPFIKGTAIGHVDQQQLRILARKMLSKRPTRISRLDGPQADLTPRLPVNRPQRDWRPRTPALTVPAPFEN